LECILLQKKKTRKIELSKISEKLDKMIFKQTFFMSTKFCNFIVRGQIEAIFIILATGNWD